ncbi:MAG: TrkA family potassium uptake protein, partial [Oscillospiraceae bacterium]|nr:TrkA family potassium uptake protein [Oscillospiraceae bacterium]
MGKQDEYTIIAGCGRLGANLANKLSEEGESVTIIDLERDAFRKLSPSYSGLTLVGDATDPGVLRDVEIERATAVVSVTNYDNTNIMVGQLAKELFGIGRVIARLYDPERDVVYRELGIDTISPAVLSIKEIDKLLQKEGDDQ